MTTGSRQCSSTLNGPSIAVSMRHAFVPFSGKTCAFLSCAPKFASFQEKKPKINRRKTLYWWFVANFHLEHPFCKPPRHPLIFTVRNSSCEKVMFSQASVCQQGVHMARGRVWHGACMAKGGACMVKGGMCGRGAGVAGETATAVDGTHPTGMHSCVTNFKSKNTKLTSRQ